MLCASTIGCGTIEYPSNPTPVTGASSTGPLPPAPPPAFTVSGIVRDGSPFPTGLHTGTVTILEGAQAGTSVSIQTGGAYAIRDLPSGTIRLSASSTGYRTAEQTVVVDGDLRADFSLPRISRSPIPPIAGTWTGLLRRDLSLRGVVEVTFVQSGMSVTATWWAPIFNDRGSFSGTIDNERTLRGRLRVDGTCPANGDLSGWIDYDERSLIFNSMVSGCGLPQVYAFEIRRCQVKSTPPVAC